MPLYEYTCEACGRTEEVLELLSAADSHACGGCGTVQGMRRQYSVPSIGTPDAGPGPAAGPSPCAGNHCDCPYAR